METWSAPSFSQPFKTHLKNSRPTGHPNILYKQVGNLKIYLGSAYVEMLCCFANATRVKSKSKCSTKRQMQSSHAYPVVHRVK